MAPRQHHGSAYKHILCSSDRSSSGSSSSSSSSSSASSNLRWPPSRIASLLPAYPGEQKQHDEPLASYGEFGADSFARKRLCDDLESAFPTTLALLRLAPVGRATSAPSMPARRTSRGRVTKNDGTSVASSTASRSRSRAVRGATITDAAGAVAASPPAHEHSALADAVAPTSADATTTRSATETAVAASARPSFDANVMGLGELRTTAHTNAKQPLYNFLARFSGPERVVGDAEYWRSVVETWCAEKKLGPVDLSTKQVSLYLRQMVQHPAISRYYGISKVDEAGGALHFALEGRPYDWSHLDSDCDDGSCDGWTCVSAGMDGRRTFASCAKGAHVEVDIRKPSYAQVCELGAVRVNGAECTPFKAFKTARDLGRFAHPEGLHKMLAAVSNVAFCKGIRKDDVRTAAAAAGTGTGTGTAADDDEGFCELVRRTRSATRGSNSFTSGGGGNDAHRSPSTGYHLVASANPYVPSEGPAKLGTVGGEPVFWSRRCRSTIATPPPPATTPTGEGKCGGSPQRCKECSDYLLSAFMPRLRHAAAAAAAAAPAAGRSGSKVGDASCSSKERDNLAATPDEEDSDIFRRLKLCDSPVGSSTRGAQGRCEDGAGIDDFGTKRVQEQEQEQEQRRRRRSHPGVIEPRRKASEHRDLRDSLKRAEIITATCAPPAEQDGARLARGGRRATGVATWQAEGGSALKRFKKRACSASPLEGLVLRRPSGRDGDVMNAALGLSTLRTLPRHRWALAHAVPGHFKVVGRKCVHHPPATKVGESGLKRNHC
ncbi:unnamed protein product [Scytosiphon promiscuus]